MTQPRIERRLARAAADIEWLRSQIPRTLAALAAETPTGWPNNQEGGHSGGHSDRTGNSAVHGLPSRQRHADIEALTVEATGLIAMLVKSVEGVADPGVDTEAEWRHHRCSGGEGEWADPFCTNLAVRTEDVAGRRLPLCWACRKRRQRYDRNLERETA